MDPLGLFLHAHIHSVGETERCLGVVEKRLLGSPRDSLLLGCKAALLLIVQSETGLARHDALYRRSALQMTRAALERTTSVTALKIRLMNGLSWARLGPAVSDRHQALAFLQVLEHPVQAGRLPPMIALEGLAALAAVNHDLGNAAQSAESFREACKIDRMRATDRYQYYRTTERRGQDVLDAVCI